MNLSDVVKIRVGESKIDSVRIPWDEDETVGFVIAYCGRDTLTNARKKSVDKKFNHKTHQVDEVLNEEKFDYEVMSKVILGWWGLKVKHLVEILDPSTVDITAEGKALEQDVPFTEEWKDIIIKHYNLTFSKFINSVITDIEVYRQYKTEKLVKNS